MPHDTGSTWMRAIRHMEDEIERMCGIPVRLTPTGRDQARIDNARMRALIDQALLASFPPKFLPPREPLMPVIEKPLLPQNTPVPVPVVDPNAAMIGRDEVFIGFDRATPEKPGDIVSTHYELRDGWGWRVDVRRDGITRWTRGERQIDLTL